MGDMKHQSGKSDSSAPPTQDWGLAQEQTDSKDQQLWDLLGEASQREPSAFFARNVVREARLLGSRNPSWGTRVIGLFSPVKLTVGAAACTCALAAYLMWPSAAPIEPPNVVDTPPTEPTSPLTELVIEESLAAAAEDPTIFTRDEVVAMIDL